MPTIIINNNNAKPKMRAYSTTLPPDSFFRRFFLDLKCALALFILFLNSFVVCSALIIITTINQISKNLYKKSAFQKQGIFILRCGKKDMAFLLSKKVNHCENDQEISLVDCSLCSQNVKDRGNYKIDEKCFICIINRMASGSKIKEIEINGVYKVPPDDLFKFKNVVSHLRRINDLLKKSGVPFQSSCFGVENFCPIPDSIIKCKKIYESKDLFQLITVTPFNVNRLLQENLNRKCNRCIKKILPMITQIKEMIDKFYESFGYEYEFNSKNQTNLDLNAISNILIGPVAIKEIKDQKQIKEQNIHTIFEDNKELIEKYVISADNLYQAEIYRVPEKYELFYQFSSLFSDPEWEIINNIRPMMFLELDKMNFFNQRELGDVIDALEKEISKIIDRTMNITEENLKKRIIRYLATNYVKIDELFPLLVDNYIEEIFLDCDGDYIYLNHQKYGRCRTSIRLKLETINALKTHIRMESRERLDRDHSSIVYVIKNKFFHCRFSIDIAPVHSENLCLDIRKINKRIFTIIDLIINNTINLDIAAFMYYCLRRRVNITVIGETDSGKTTLINALDLLVPSHFRKIYLEDVLESLDHKPYDLHQLKYVISGGADNLEQTKAAQIKKLLHRSPDFVYLGEILTKEECEAMFHCLSAGLKGLQTTHGFDIHSTITRWEIHFGIPKLCFNDLGLIITIKKVNNRRFVTGIYELEYNESKLFIREFFSYNPFKNDWFKREPFICSKIFRQIVAIEPITEEDYNHEIAKYREYFAYFADNSEYLNQNVDQLIRFYEKVDYSLRMNNELLEIASSLPNSDNSFKIKKNRLRDAPIVVNEYEEEII